MMYEVIAPSQPNVKEYLTGHSLNPHVIELEAEIKRCTGN